MKKFCTKCNKEALFSRTGKYCKECNKAYQRKHYLENKASYYKRSRNQKYKLLEITSKLKETPCNKCGKKYPSIAMDFHHLRDKDSSISNLVRDQVSVKRLQTEIEKCIVVCAVCHRLIHAGLV